MFQTFTSQFILVDEWTSYFAREQCNHVIDSTCFSLLRSINLDWNAIFQSLTPSNKDAIIRDKHQFYQDHALQTAQKGSVARGLCHMCGDHVF